MTSTIKGTTVKNGDITSWEQIQLGIEGTEVVAQRVRITVQEGREKIEEVLESKVLASF